MSEKRIFKNFPQGYEPTKADALRELMRDIDDHYDIERVRQERGLELEGPYAAESVVVKQTKNSRDWSRRTGHDKDNRASKEPLKTDKYEVIITKR